METALVKSATNFSLSWVMFDVNKHLSTMERLYKKSGCSQKIISMMLYNESE